MQALRTYHRRSGELFSVNARFSAVVRVKYIPGCIPLARILPILKPLFSPRLFLHGFIIFSHLVSDNNSTSKRELTQGTMSRLGHRAWKLYMSSSCQKPEPEHSEPSGTKRKQELQLERQDDNAHAYTSRAQCQSNLLRWGTTLVACP
jgi:hypothetical protein